MSAAPVPLGPKGPPMLGQLLAFRRDPIEFLSRIAREYPGDVVRFRPGPRDSYLVKDPELIKEVLVTRQHDFSKSRGLEWAKLFLGEGLLTSEGEFHTRQRRLAQPAFHRQRIGGYADDMVQRTVDARDHWAAGQVLDVDGEMMRLTLAVVSSTLFGTDVAASADEVREDLAAIIALFPRFSLPLFGLIQKLPLPSNARFNRAVARLDALVYRIIAERQRDPADRGDLLSMLLLARDEESGERMSDRQLRDEVITLLLAGHETTSNALTWTWYLLSQNPEAEARWREELGRVLGDRPATAGDLPALRYTEMVLAESMRLFPPAWGMGRRALLRPHARRFRDPQGRHPRPLALRRPSRRALLAGPSPLRSGALHRRGQGGAPALRLLPVRGGSAQLHRRALRLDGRRAAAGHDRPALAAAPAARPSRGAEGAHDAAPALRDEDDRRARELAARPDQ